MGAGRVCGGGIFIGFLRRRIPPDAKAELTLYIKSEI
jgi:hypothetical protein